MRRRGAGRKRLPAGRRPAGYSGLQVFWALPT